MRRVVMECTLNKFGLGMFKEFAAGELKQTEEGIKYIVLENN